MKNYVTVDRKVAEEARVWAKKNCACYINSDYHITTDWYVEGEKRDFFFADSEAGRRDMAWFALKWA